MTRCREELAPYVSCFHEGVHVGDVVDQRDDVCHFSADRRQNGTNVLESFPRLGTHVAWAYHLAVAIESDLSLEVYEPTVALNHAHRECTERRPYVARIEAIHHRMTPRSAAFVG